MPSNTVDQAVSFQLSANNNDDADDLSTEIEKNDFVDENLKLFRSNRSKTMPPKTKEYAKGLNLNPDRLKMAKEDAERAIKQKKIFTIIGPYPALREALRNRGWIEKFENMNPLPIKKLKKRNKDDDDKNDDDIDGDNDGDEDPEEDDSISKLKPWEENNGYYGILSRLVKNFPPSLIWSVRSANVDHSCFNKDQLYNHFNKNGAFTTKIGLCSNLRNLHWYSTHHSEEFFPRCFKLSQEEDKQDFIDNYRLTCCISILKYALQKYHGEPDNEPHVHITSAKELDLLKSQAEIQQVSLNEPTSALSRIDSAKIDIDLSSTLEPLISLGEPQRSNSRFAEKADSKAAQSKPNASTNNKLKKKLPNQVPREAIEFAIERLRVFIDFKEHIDIDKADELPVSDEKWNQFIEWFYLACHDKVPIKSIEQYVSSIENVLNYIKMHWPQYHMDGTNSIWIVKPGAKSRGRGIIVFDKLENILELTTSTLQREGKFVVQKYIERPLLIHNIKFDIRQWFLVSDFNPLTIWIYKDCYLRFCTEEFTLEDTKESIHLCNYSIQKNYKNATDRNCELPEENMWTNQEFVDKYLAKMGKRNMWEDSIFPEIKNSIIGSMLSAQDVIENRKNSFELYGADFMITDDLKPWLIEINCSPTMARSTEITSILCDNVLDDICKVMIDRRINKNADIGKFEIMYKAAPVQAPNYVGIDLSLDGRGYAGGKTSSKPPASTTSGASTSPRHSVVLQSQKSSSPNEMSGQLPSLDSNVQETTTKLKGNKVSLKLRKESTLPAIMNMNTVSVATSQAQQEIMEQIKTKRLQNDPKGVNATIRALNNLQINTQLQPAIQTNPSVKLSNSNNKGTGKNMRRNKKDKITLVKDSELNAELKISKCFASVDSLETKPAKTDVIAESLTEISSNSMQIANSSKLKASNIKEKSAKEKSSTINNAINNTVIQLRSMKSRLDNNNSAYASSSLNLPLIQIQLF